MRANEAIADRFEEYADLLEAEGDEYRPRSYRRAADSLRQLPRAVDDLAEDGPEALQEIDGVGESIAEKIVEYVREGRIKTIEEKRAELPVNIAELTAVEGVGPRTVGDLYSELGVTTLDELEAAAREGRIRDLAGYGEKTEANILENIEFARQAGERSLLGNARLVADEVLAYLGEADGVERCEVAGSLRRWRETIGDVDVLATGSDREAIVDRLLAWEGAVEIESGPEKASVRVEAAGWGDRDAVRGTRVDLRVVDPSEWGSALQYFTGSKEHNIRLRNYAIERDFKINEYGIFDVSELGSDGSSDSSDGVSDVDDPDAGQRVGDRVGGAEEADIYDALGLEPMAPELREDTGEIAAAATGDLPDLVAVEDVRGDLHVHTEWSDGDLSIEETVAAAAEFDHDYVCICDHASGPGVVGGMGLDDEELHEQLETVREVAETAEIDVLAGVEANIDADGRVSVGEEVLATLDLVIASPHSGLDGDGTDRLVGAIEHPHVDVIGHPTGRLLNQRPGFDIDVDRIAEAAAEHGVALEVNANPHRLDLAGEAVRAAVDAGAPIAVNTDAHRPTEFEYLRFGVHTARRGWAERDDVLNTRDVDGLRSFLG